MRDTTVWVLVATYVGSLAVGWRLQKGEPSPGARLLAGIVPAALLTFGWVAVGEFLLSCSRDWNDARLAPAAGFVRGYDLYYRSGEGPLLGNIYGPLSAVMYAPAALLSTPAAVVSAAVLMTIGFFYCPAFVILLVEARRRKVAALPTAACLASFALFALHTSGLADAGFWIHADAPALAFVAIACGVLYLRRAPGIATSVISSLAAMLAVLTKQVALPVVLLLPFCCWLLEGRAALRTYLVCWVAVAAAVAAIVLALVDFDAMFFNAMTVPGAHPWQLTGMQLVATVTSELARATLLPAVVLGLHVSAGRSGSGKPADPSGFLAYARRERWVLWMVVALAMVPMSVLGRAVVGGETNALTYTLYLPAIAMHLVILRALAPRADSAEPATRSGAEGPRLGLALLLALLALEAAPRVVSVPAATEIFSHSEERTGFAFAKRHPDQVYFPANPLFPLLAEGKAHHCSSGVYDRYLASVEMTNDYLAEFLPAQIRWVAYPNEADFSMNYLQAFSERVELPELPGWTVLQLPASMRER